MPTEILKQRSWNAGEIDPDLLGRDDVSATKNGAALISDCLCLPQGPLTGRPGQTHNDLVRHELVALDLSAVTWAAPNGGTAGDAAAIDGTPVLTTADLAATNGYVVLTLDFGAPVTVGLVDVVDYGLHDTGSGAPPAVVPISYPWAAIGLHFGETFYYNIL